MKKYRCVLIDFDIKTGARDYFKKIVFEKYANGLKQARGFCNIPVKYNNNCKCFTGWKNNKNFVVTEI